MPMDPDAIRTYIQAALPDAEVIITDLAGDNDHFAVRVVSPSFAGKPRIAQHRLVQEALKGKLGTELHALSVQTAVPDGDA